jgi:hypothetical protein
MTPSWRSESDMVESPNTIGPILIFKLYQLRSIFATIKSTL